MTTIRPAYACFSLANQKGEAGNGDHPRPPTRRSIVNHPGGGGVVIGNQNQPHEPINPQALAFVWHLDEVVITIAGQQHWLWRAVDQDGYVLDEIVQTGRDTKAARRLLKRLLKKHGSPPRRLITDKLGSYAAARRQIMPAVDHRSHKGLNNRAENSHLPLRKRERAMQGFRSPGALQRFASVLSAVGNLFVPPRSHRSALATHLHRLQAMVAWKSAAGVAA